RAKPKEIVSFLSMRVSSGFDSLSRDLCLSLAMTRQPSPITPSGQHTEDERGRVHRKLLIQLALMTVPKPSANAGRTRMVTFRARARSDALPWSTLAPLAARSHAWSWVRDS